VTNAKKRVTRFLLQLHQEQSSQSTATVLHYTILSYFLIIINGECGSYETSPSDLIRLTTSLHPTQV